MTDVSINTVTKLLVDLGLVCAKYQYETLTNLPCKRIECDEIWSFVGAKDQNVPEEKRGQFGLAQCGRGRRSAPTRRSFRPG